MFQVVGLVVIAIGFLLVAFAMKPSPEREDIRRTKGVIDRVIYSDEGNVMYYVRFVENEQKIMAQTVSYSYSTKSLNPDEEVEIGYYYTKKGRPRAIIFDDRITRCSEESLIWIKIFNIIGAAFLLLAFYVAVKNFLL